MPSPSFIGNHRIAGTLTLFCIASAMVLCLAEPARADEASTQARLDELEARFAEFEGLRDSLAAIKIMDEENELLAQLAQEEIATLRARVSRMPSLGGYFDFEFIEESGEDRPSYFRQHHFTLLLTHEFEDWRLFGEIEYENGTLIEGEGEAEAEVVRGALKLENAWIERAFRDELIVRGGLMFTPSHSVVHQWPNLWPTTRRALLFKIYPEKQVGIAVHGSAHKGAIRSSYMAYLSNGQSSNFARRDDNADKAVGAHAVLHLAEAVGVRTLDLGINLYRENPDATGRDDLWGLEFRAEEGRFSVWTEYVNRMQGVRREGLYVQPRVGLHERLHALYRFDLVQKDGTEDRTEHTVGIQFRAHDRVQLKLEVYRSSQNPGEDIDGVAASCAAAF